MVFLMDFSLLYSHLNWQLRRKERSVSAILVANLLIKTKHLGIRGESLNLIVIFTYQNDFAAQVFLLFLKYISPIVTCFSFPPRRTKRAHGRTRTASFILLFRVKGLGKTPSSWKHKTVN